MCQGVITCSVCLGLSVVSRLQTDGLASQQQLYMICVS